MQAQETAYGVVDVPPGQTLCLGTNYSITLVNITDMHTMSRNFSFITMLGYMDVYYKTFMYWNYVINLYGVIVLYIIGLLPNILTVYIWLRPKMRQSSGIYLAALGFDNVLYQVLSTVPNSTIYWRSKSYHTACQFFVVPYYTLQYAAPMLVLGFTVERYISVCHPFRRDKLCTQERAVIVVICLYLIALALGSPQGYFWYYDYTREGCTVRPELRAGGGNSVWSIWKWFTEMTVFVVIPLAVLAFNVIVMVETKRLLRKANELAPTKKQLNQSATTLTLLAVSFFLIIVSIPVGVCYIVDSYFPEGNDFLPCLQQAHDDKTWNEHHSFQNKRAPVDFIGRSQFAVNFYIYLLVSHKFRLECRRLLGRLGVRQGEDKSVTATSEWFAKYGARSETMRRSVGSSQTSVDSTFRGRGMSLATGASMDRMRTDMSRVAGTSESSLFKGSGQMKTSETDIDAIVKTSETWQSRDPEQDNLLKNSPTTGSDDVLRKMSRTSDGAMTSPSRTSVNAEYYGTTAEHIRVKKLRSSEARPGRRKASDRSFREGNTSRMSLGSIESGSRNRLVKGVARSSRHGSTLYGVPSHGSVPHGEHGHGSISSLGRDQAYRSVKSAHGYVHDSQV